MIVLGEALVDGEGVYLVSLGATVGIWRRVIFSGGAHCRLEWVSHDVAKF